MFLEAMLDASTNDGFFEIFLLLMPVRLTTQSSNGADFVTICRKGVRTLQTANVKDIYSLEFLTPENRPSAIPKVVFQSSFLNGFFVKLRGCPRKLFTTFQGIWSDEPMTSRLNSQVLKSPTPYIAWRTVCVRIFSPLLFGRVVTKKEISCVPFLPGANSCKRRSHP